MSGGGAETAEALLRRASQLRQAGRVEEAIAAYEAAIALDPRSANAWYNLGWLQRRARRFDAALASYAEALARGVAGPEEVHLNRAVIYADDLARPDEAEAELEAALALRPDYVPALLNLGNLHEDRGERARAREAYERAVAAEPRNALALARLAGVAEVGGPEEPLIGRVRSALTAPSLGTDARADLGFALGRLLDAAGSFDDAFEAYRGANAASRAAAGVRYDPDASEALVDGIIAAFPERALGRSASDGSAPVFICGMFRSGSTLTEQILARHSKVTPGGELDLVPALVRGRFSPYPEAASGAPQQALEDVRRWYVDSVRRLHPGAGLVTDKRPDNFLHIGLIKAIFPEARIVHTRRDPLDNILSAWFLHLEPTMAWALDLEDAAHWYRQYRRLMAHWEGLYRHDIHQVDYDALVADPRSETEALLGFLGLGWEEQCLTFHEASNPVKTASAWQVREPLYRRSSGRWRHYERHLGPLREALAGI